MLRRLILNSKIRNKIFIRNFTTKKPVPNPKPDFDHVIVGILIFLGVGQWLKFIEYKKNFHIKK